MSKDKKHKKLKDKDELHKNNNENNVEYNIANYESVLKEVDILTS